MPSIPTDKTDEDEFILGSVPLPHRREAFVRLLIEGKSGLQAYKQVYECDDNTAKANAARLLSYDSVVQRRDYLNGIAAKAVIVTKGELVNICADIARDTDTDKKDRLNAVDKLAKLKGFFAPEKVEGTFSTPKQREALADEISLAVLDLHGKRQSVAKILEKAVRN